MSDAHRIRGIAAGREFEIETGLIARSARGAVVARQGETVVLAVVVTGADADESFLPLTVEYREKSAAAGLIPGGHLRRDVRATEAEILGARLIDRSIRPLFPRGFTREIQMSVTVMSYESGDDAVVLGINAASAALCCSDIPWNGPVGAVRVALVDDDLVAAPTPSQRAAAFLDMVAAFTPEGMVMAEGRMQAVSEQRVLEAMAWAGAQAAPLLQSQDTIRGPGGSAGTEATPDEVETALGQILLPWVRDLVNATSAGDREGIRAGAVKDAMEALAGSAGVPAVTQAAARITRSLVRQAVLHGYRMDGRGRDEVRPISALVGWLPRAHGSAVFTRGDTQAVVTCTLGTSREDLQLESLEGTIRRSFFVHYNFPQYAVGELGQWRGPGRRELGHGNLARMALEPAVPSSGSFPFTVRVESEVTQSDGSSSMATVCGGSLALMEAGVPVSDAVAGVSMGVVRDGARHVVLTDITAEEDHAGDMDLKAAGTRRGLTAIQMDTKATAVPAHVLAEVLAQARHARLRILDVMDSVRDRPRSDLPDGVPRIVTLRIRPGGVKELLGPSGKTIQEIQARTGARVEVDRQGVVRVYADRGESLAGAVARIRDLAGIVEVNGEYRGSVVSLTPEGAFVRLFGSEEGFLPLGPGGGLKEGDAVSVRAVGVDRKGRIALTADESFPSDDLPPPTG